jgi:hypothetical protein
MVNSWLYLQTLDKAEKACQRQTIKPIHNLGRKSVFLYTGPCILLFFAIQASYKRRLTVLSLSIIDIAVIKAENRV